MIPNQGNTEEIVKYILIILYAYLYKLFSIYILNRPFNYIMEKLKHSNED